MFGSAIVVLVPKLDPCVITKDVPFYIRESNPYLMLSLLAIFVLITIATLYFTKKSSRRTNKRLFTDYTNVYEDLNSLGRLVRSLESPDSERQYILCCDYIDNYYEWILQYQHDNVYKAHYLIEPHNKFISIVDIALHRCGRLLTTRLRAVTQIRRLRITDEGEADAGFAEVLNLARQMIQDDLDLVDTIPDLDNVCRIVYCYF